MMYKWYHDKEYNFDDYNQVQFNVLHCIHTANSRYQKCQITYIQMKIIERADPDRHRRHFAFSSFADNNHQKPQKEGQGESKLVSTMIVL